MAILEFDEDRARAIEATYATPDVVAQRKFTLDLLGLQPGERVLDVGFGPGSTRLGRSRGCMLGIAYHRMSVAPFSLQKSLCTTDFRMTDGL